MVSKMLTDFSRHLNSPSQSQDSNPYGSESNTCCTRLPRHWIVKHGSRVRLHMQPWIPCFTLLLFFLIHVLYAHVK